MCFYLNITVHKCSQRYPLLKQAKFTGVKMLLQKSNHFPDCPSELFWKPPKTDFSMSHMFCKLVLKLLDPTDLRFNIFLHLSFG